MGSQLVGSLPIHYMGDNWLVTYDTLDTTQSLVTSKYVAYIEILYSENDWNSINSSTSTFYEMNTNYSQVIDFERYEDVVITQNYPLIILVSTDEYSVFYSNLVNNLSKIDVSCISIYEEYSIDSRALPIESCIDAECLGGGGDIGGGTTISPLVESHGNIYLSTKIGVIEMNNPDFTYADLGYMNWLIDNPYIPTSNHATAIVNTIRSTYTSISQYSLFLSTATYAYELMSSIDWMISNDVHIINMSLGIDSETTYDIVARYSDFVSKNNNVLMVTADSNYSPNNPVTQYVSSPGLGYNVISVGAVTSDYVYTTSSGYLETIQVSKPNLVENDTFISPGTSDGTSYSAPRVSARIAQVLYSNPSLKYNLPLLLSIIHASSSRSQVSLSSPSLESSGFDDKIGVGLLDTSYFSSILINNQYRCYNILTLSGYNQILTDSFVISSGKTIYLSSAMLVNVSNSISTFPSLGYAPYTLKIYVNGNLQSPILYGNNILYTSFVVPNNSTVTFVISITGTVSTESYDISVSWR